MDEDKELYGGLIRLHILHHAGEKPIFGHWVITELQQHGYRLSPGTLYPLLHGLARKGYLRPLKEQPGDHGRRTYRITPAGRRALNAAKQRVWELFGELFETESRHGPAGAQAKGKPREATARSRSRPDSAASAVP